MITFLIAASAGTLAVTALVCGASVIEPASIVRRVLDGLLGVEG